MADLYDYVSPNFERIDGDWAFPKMWKTRDQAVKCTDGTERNSPHWYRCDVRWERIGFVTFDEAHILYNAALQFRGKRALEIGCHVGYSSWHLLAGGVELAICDPVLNRVPEIRVDVDQSLMFFRGNYHLLGEPSPDAVYNLAAKFAPWSLIFIDGQHDAPYPMIDMLASAQFAADDAMILFHDGWNRGVTDAIWHLKSYGWDVRVFDTCAFMAAAWRGDVEPIHHIPDPAVVAQPGKQVIPEELRPEEKR